MLLGMMCKPTLLITPCSPLVSKQRTAVLPGWHIFRARLSSCSLHARVSVQRLAPQRESSNSMNHNQGRPQWPLTFKLAGVVSKRPQSAAPPGVNVKPGAGAVERKVQPGYPPPVYRPCPAVHPFQPKTSVAPCVSSQPGLPPAYQPIPPPQLLRARMPVMPAVGNQPGSAPPMYRPNSQGEGMLRPTNLLPQRQPIPIPGPNVPKGGQQPAYALQAPMPLSGGVQEIRVGLRASPGSVGSVRLRPAGSGKVYISDLEVTPEHRRHGVASMLLQAALRTAAAQGRRGALLEAAPAAKSISPQSLVAMYQRLGFRQTGLSDRGKPLMEFGPGVVQRKTPIQSTLGPKSSGVGERTGAT
jgi:predicted GNAT family acetyltransferase